MKNTPFILLILGIAFIWLGLTGRLGAVLAAIFEPSKLESVGGAPAAAKETGPSFSELPGSGGKILIPNDPYSGLGGIIQ